MFAIMVDITKIIKPETIKSLIGKFSVSMELIILILHNI